MKKILVLIALGLLASGCEYKAPTTGYSINHGGVTEHTMEYQIGGSCISFNNKIVCGSFEVYPN